MDSNVESLTEDLKEAVEEADELPTPSDPSSDKKPEKENKVMAEVMDWIQVIVIAVVAALLINHFLISNATIPTGSMEDTIRINDRVIGLRASYWFSSPARGDIVVFRYPDDETTLYIKRVIGLPGETVEIKDGKVYINGSDTPLKEDYVKGTPRGNYGPYEVPEDSYFMLGDNRNDSKDSRFWLNTYVKREKILSKAMFRYWPSFAWLGDTPDYGEDSE